MIKSHLGTQPISAMAQLRAAGLLPLLWGTAGDCSLPLYAVLWPERQSGSLVLTGSIACVLLFCALARREALADILFGRIAQTTGKIRRSLTLRGYTEFDLDCGERYRLAFGPLRYHEIAPGKNLSITYLKQSRIVLRHDPQDGGSSL